MGRGGGFGIEFDEGVVVAVGAELAKMLTCHSHVDRVVVPTLKTIVKVLGDPSAEILKVQSAKVLSWFRQPCLLAEYRLATCQLEKLTGGGCDVRCADVSE